MNSPKRSSSGGKKRNQRSVPRGRVYIKVSFNNTMVTITDDRGDVLTIASAGSCGFQGTKKGTAYAASIVVDRAVNLARNNHNLKTVRVFVKGIGQGRETAVRGLISGGLNIESLADVTPLAHGGVRPRGVRHV